MESEYLEESFWQRVGLKKADREMPLYALGNASQVLVDYRRKMLDVFKKSINGQREILKRKLEVI